ncbi:MAG: hypothetical protein JJT75_12390 [Opitutales bacterium]|nr:hypothetical protein [Opitutales bacterium]
MKALYRFFPFFFSCAIILFVGVSAKASPAIFMGDIVLVPKNDGAGEFLWLDRELGVARLAALQANGTVHWGEAFDTGLAPVSDAAGSVDLDGTASWAVASNSANGVTFITSNGLIPSPQNLAATGVGPRLVASPSNGLMLVHTENGAPDPQQAQLLENLTNIPPTVLDTLALVSTNQPRQLLPLPGTSVSMLLSQAGNSRQVKALTQGGSTLMGGSPITVGGLMEMQTGVNDANGDPVVFLWTPGGVNVLGTYFWNGAGLVTRTTSLSFSPGIVVPFDLTTVAVTSQDGSQTIIATVNGDGSLTIQETLSPSSGDRLFGAVKLGPDHRIVFSGPAVSSRPETFHIQEWNGSGWVNVQSDSIPELPLPEELGTNVFFFAADPFVAPGSALLGGAQFADWSAKPDPFVSLPASLTLEEYVDELSGLGNLLTQAPPAPTGTGYALTNQYRPSLSIALMKEQSAVRRPQVGVAPASGTYPRTIEVSLDYDSRRLEAWIRFGDEAAWTPLPAQVLVAYSTEISVYVRDQSTGLSSPIVTRNYVIDPDEMQENDANGDGLPDFVRQAYGLDPLGPHDSAGNGLPDFIEILLGHDPLDPLDAPDPEDIPPYFSGYGLILLGSALAPNGQPFDYGHTLTARRVDNRLLARGKSMDGSIDSDSDGVGDLEEILFGTDPGDPDSVNPDGSVDAAFYSALDKVAPLRGAQVIPASNGLVLHSAATFKVNDGDPLGREVVALLVPPEPRRPEIPNITLTGVLTTDAEAWRTAALNAYATFRPEPDLVELTPDSTLRAVAVEAMLWEALDTLDPTGTPAQNKLTVFPWRTPDTGRAAVVPVQLQSLAQSGLPLRTLIEGVDAYFADNNLSALATVTDEIYLDHMNNGIGEARPLPLDTLRRFFSLTPDAEALEADLEDILTPTQIGDALSEAGALLGIASGLQRPAETWTLVMGSPDLLAPNRYERDDTTMVELFHATGRPFRIDQGVGLAPGTSFEVYGFTDLTGSDGHPGMEVISLVFTATPLASNTDSDGNLLDDRWENFYFGTTGLDPFTIPVGKNHTLLEFFLEGMDPRGAIAPAGGPVIPTALPQMIFSQFGSSGGTLVFPWPSKYDSQLDFIVETSLDLQVFSPDPTLVPSRVGNELQVSIPGPTGDKAFYRLRLKLAE